MALNFRDDRLLDAQADVTDAAVPLIVNLDIGFDVNRALVIIIVVFMIVSTNFKARVTVYLCLFEGANDSLRV